MASTLFKPPPTFTSPAAGSSALRSANFPCVSFVSVRQKCPLSRYRTYRSAISSRIDSVQLPLRLAKKFSLFASNEEAVETQVESPEDEQGHQPELESESETEGSSDGAVDVDDVTESEGAVAEESASAVLASLNLYKEAFTNNDELKVAEVESFLKSIEDEKIELERKVATLSEELSYERTRVLRISADFDNFRKRTERERLSLVTNAQGEVVESLLSVLDNFERAKTQIKVETEGEEKINNSYQSIYKQFVEILASLGVIPVETVGKPFDPMLHEAIMREDSTEFEEGIILEEYRKGFQLGDRLLRPSMVKVSAGPGPAKAEAGEASEEQKGVDETSEGSNEETSSEE